LILFGFRVIRKKFHDNQFCFDFICVLKGYCK